ncbi:MAG: hypothetical protein HLUCCA11_03670 [Phormidesmis priestleyi Ana]|uniref:Uncharacterized protein n=1 Tax=Phormidesmis priestleyi Ana TaxID=1666911 RepID=A0A0P8DJQ0_9CYAN|nr:MAG: hypothetical protein HLUCCA11_03670 [Phormidesmis priestleyi Ana]
MDTLLITIYILVVLYVLYQMSLSLEDELEDKVEIFVEDSTLEKQTQAQLSMQPGGRNITARVEYKSFGKDKKVKRPALSLIFDADTELPSSPKDRELQKALKMSDKALQEYLHPKIIIRIAPTNLMPMKPPIKFISVFINNDTADMQVCVNWDRSSIEMFGQGNRVVRNTPNIPVDLSRSQVPTFINPGMTVSSNITTESRYNRNPDSGLLQTPIQPVINLEERIGMAKPTDPTSGEENIQALYALDLMVSMKHRTAPDHESVSLLIPFIFKMKIKVDKPAFPPMRWWLRNFGRRRPSRGNWFWGSRPKEEK